MQLSWRTSESIEGGFHLPGKLVFFFDDGEKRQSIELKQVEAHKVGDFIKSELGHHDGLLSLKMESENSHLSFCFLINPVRKIIYIPPGGLVTNKKYLGAGSKMQNVFEQIASRNGYKLMVCVAANEMGVFNQRIGDLLRQKEGYHMAPPQKSGPNAKQFGVHQSTYDETGIPDIGVPHEAMLLAGKEPK